MAISEIRFRRGTAAAWATTSEILDEGEPGYDTTNRILKIGDGVNRWPQLPSSGGGGTGAPGLSAYDVAVVNGFVGTQAEWLDTLRGEDGVSTDGEDGASAYEIAVLMGFVGTELEWLESLKGQDGVGSPGDPGDPGASAYEVAVANGFVGSETAWLESLRGADGNDAVFSPGGSVVGLEHYDTYEEVPIGPAGTIYFVNATETTPPPTGTAPTVTTTSLNTLTQNSAFTQTLAADGDAPIAWAVSAGTLPAGLALSSAGVLSGTPSTAGAYSFTVTATNSTGSDTQQFTGTVAAAAASALSVFKTTTPATATVGTDGGGSLVTGNYFYTTRTGGITVVGARVWVPVDATLAALDVTVRAYTRDWTGVDINDGISTGATLRQTKVLPGGRAQGAWASVMFDTTFTVPAIAASGAAGDAVAITVQYAGGNHYVIPTWTGLTNTDGFNGGSGTTWYAEDTFRRGITNVVNNYGTQTHYGVDLLYTEA